MIFKKQKLVKCIVVYCSQKYNQIIIAPMHENNERILYEQDVCFIYDFNLDDEKFGTEIINCLNLYSQKEKQLQFYKKSEWSSFKHSKLKVIKTFEKEYTRISISSVNDSNLLLRIECPIKETNLLLSSYLSFYAPKNEIGNRIREIYNELNKFND